MHSPLRRAASALPGLIAAAAATFGSPVHAQTDPFALPDGLTVQTVAQDDAGPLLSEIVVDGREGRRMVTLRGRGQAMTIDADEARAAGLPVPDGAHDAVRLADLKLYRWSFDPLRQRLTVALFRKSDGGNLRDLASQTREPSESTPLLAMRIDYDLTASATPHGAAVGGYGEFTVVRGNFAVGTTARIASNPIGASAPLVRLDTRAQVALESRGILVTAGDFISAGSQTQRAVRMGGLQVATNFELRPDLITTPLPAFSGQVAVPTALDIVSADERLSLGKVEPGEFTVRNIPSVPGRGELSVVLRDPLGREVIQTARFYVSRDLLAPHVTGFAVNAGFVRRRYGEVSNDYGPFAATAYLRRGLSPHLTVEGSGEWTPGLTNLGARADFVVANFVKATVEGRISHDSLVGSGRLVNIAAESIGPKFGVAAGATFPSATYRDVASRLGDAAPSKQLFANAFYRFAADTQAQLSYVRQESRADARLLRPGGRNETFGGNFQAQLSPRLRLFTSAGYRRSDFGNAVSVSAGISLNLGPARHAGAYVSSDAGRVSGGATYAKDDLNDGDIGYHAAVNASTDSQRVGGGVAWRDRHFRLEGEAEEVDGSFAARANARGTLLIAGGAVYARNQSGGSYALVRTGEVAGVPITRENRLVGVTDSKGRLLVQDIPALANIKIDVDADKLPGEALVHETTHIIRVPRRAVSLVTIDAVRFRPVMRALVGPDGKALPAGLPVRILPSGEITLTGFDGMVEINAGGNDRQLLVGAAANGCVVSFDPRALEADFAADPATLPPLACRPRPTIAEADAEPQVAPKHKRRRGRRGAQVAQRDFAVAPSAGE